MRSAQQVLNQHLKEKGIRQSGQRNKVLKVFLNTERHLTANELYGLVKKRYPRIGYATVYRAMKVITEAGIAEEMELGDGAKRYEHKYGHEHHDHLICLKCGKFVEIVNPRIERLQKKVAGEHGFTLARHKLNMFGICRECSEKEK